LLKICDYRNWLRTGVLQGWDDVLNQGLGQSSQVDDGYAIAIVEPDGVSALKAEVRLEVVFFSVRIRSLRHKWLKFVFFRKLLVDYS
jgi:hypothetical protein